MSTQGAAPPPPTPDDKDWTWVTERACPECGFDAGATDPTDVSSLLRQNLDDWTEILGRDPALVTTRPAPTTWSAAEYAAHVRDVFEVYDGRLRRMRTEDGPHYANWDQDATALEQRYDRQSPSEILPALRSNGARLADQFDLVTGVDWERTGFRSDGAGFTIRTFAQYFIHDPVHHVHDARNGMASLSEVER